MRPKNRALKNDVRDTPGQPDRLKPADQAPTLDFDPDLDFFGLLLFEVMMWDVDRKRLPMWVVYSNAKDYPGQYVARLWYTMPVVSATPTVLQANLQTIRAALSSHGYVKETRYVDDDPCIEEVWL